MNATVHVHTKTLRRKFVQLRFERMEIVIAHHQQDGRARLPHVLQMKCELWKEIPLALESSTLWQQITRNQDEARFIALNSSHQLFPLGNVLVQIGGQQKM